MQNLNSDSNVPEQPLHVDLLALRLQQLGRADRAAFGSLMCHLALDLLTLRPHLAVPRLYESCVLLTPASSRRQRALGIRVLHLSPALIDAAGHRRAVKNLALVHAHDFPGVLLLLSAPLLAGPHNADYHQHRHQHGQNRARCYQRCVVPRHRSDADSSAQQRVFRTLVKALVRVLNSEVLPAPVRKAPLVPFQILVVVELAFRPDAHVVHQRVVRVARFYTRVSLKVQRIATVHTLCLALVDVVLTFAHARLKLSLIVVTLCVYVLTIAAVHARKLHCAPCYLVRAVRTKVVAHDQVSSVVPFLGLDVLAVRRVGDARAPTCVQPRVHRIVAIWTAIRAPSVVYIIVLN